MKKIDKKDLELNVQNIYSLNTASDGTGEETKQQGKTTCVDYTLGNAEHKTCNNCGTDNTVCQTANAGCIETVGQPGCQQSDVVCGALKTDKSDCCIEIPSIAVCIDTVNCAKTMDCVESVDVCIALTTSECVD